MAGTKCYGKLIHSLIVLLLALSLGITALPTVGIVEANGGPGPFFAEDFEGGLPWYWTVVSSQGCDWRDDDPEGRGALDGCSGTFMIADSDWCGQIDMDTELITPSINCFTYEKVILEFDHYFHYYSGGGDEKGDVDIWDGSAWHNVARYQSSDTEGHVAIDISDIAAGKSDVKIRWHYYDAYWDWYWEVDNIELSGTSGVPVHKYLHAEGGLIDLAEPLGTQWHELYPLFGRDYHLSSWEDNGDGILSHCDTIDMYEKPDGELRDYHVEDVTITLLVTNNVTGDPMYMELEGGFNSSILTYPPGPVGTLWHEIYPEFSRTYNLTDWTPTGNPRTELDYCDYISLEGYDISPVMYPLDEDFSPGIFPPGGWATEDWLYQYSNVAGGTPGEAWLSGYGPTIDGDAYLQSKPVDTTGAGSLTLEFKSYIFDLCANGTYNCTVYTRASGGDSWTNVTPWSNPIYGDVGPGTYQVDISADIGTATQVRFDFDGPWECLNIWFVDDVKISYPVWWHVEEVAVDIVVTPEPPPVGGEAYPVSKASLLAPWIAVGAVLAGGISWYVLRRRRTGS